MPVLSRAAEYAVRASLWLARPPQGCHTVRQIAEAAAVPAPYLAKILQALARSGVVSAQPGPGGGFTLRRAPEEITLQEVISAVDPIHRIRECPLELPEHSGCLCPFHARLDQAIAYVLELFENCTLADLLAESDNVLCVEPGPSAANETLRAAPDAARKSTDPPPAPLADAAERPAKKGSKP